ncbi:MAG: PASTA domain-containing protein [Alistipes ihumii]
MVAVKTYNAPGHRRYYYGGTVAGPVFKAIADRVYAKNTAWQKPVSETGGKSAKKPFVKAGRVEQMREVGYRFDIPYEGRRREKPWKELASIDSTGAVYTEYDERGGKVPCVVGMGLKDAIYLLERQGMIVSFSGVGTVLSQSVPAGSKARRGQTVSLILGVEPLPEGETVRHEKNGRNRNFGADAHPGAIGLRRSFGAGASVEKLGDGGLPCGAILRTREAESAVACSEFGESGWCRRFSARCRSCRRSGRDGKTFCRFGRRCGICWRR